MRNIPAALQTHIEGEVLSLTRCIKITRNDGVVLRLTTHDIDITVDGDVYRADIPLEFSALESTDTLAVDNAEITVGLDDAVVTLVDMDSGLYDNAPFELFAVNWESVGDGVIPLKRGFLGDIEISDEVSAKIQLRGLTHLLQKPIVERYSLTCRAALGSARCGYVNMPTRVRRDRQRVKTFDWFLNPVANVTTPVVSNLGFESSLTGWTVPDGSSWSAAAAITPAEGAAYLVAGAGDVGKDHVIYRDITTADLGMADADVDDGLLSIDFSSLLAGTSASFLNLGRLYVEMYDATGITLRRSETALVEPSYEEWEGIGVTDFVMPGCRTIRFGVISRIAEGSSGYVAFDDMAIRWWTNELSTWGSIAYRTVKLPSYQNNEMLGFTNSDLELDGEVGNTDAGFTGWTAAVGNFWRTVASIGTVVPQDGTTFLFGGDDGSTTPLKVYELSQSILIPRAPVAFATAAEAAAYYSQLKVSDEATAANIDAGWYYCELQGDVVRTDADSAPRIVVDFIDDADAVISSIDTGYLTGLTTDVWSSQKSGKRVPVGTREIRLSFYAKSGAAGSAANVGFDDVRVYVTPTAYEHENDAETGLLAATVPTLGTGVLDYTLDGDALVQAKSVNFGYGAVTGVSSNRIFSVSALSDTAENLYSGKVVWLSGNNAGKVSFIRVWDNTTKLMKLYDTLKSDIQVGDTFVYARGCDKTIDTCADLFGNAHNFRGEPYIPGPNKVITFMTSES